METMAPEDAGVWVTSRAGSVISAGSVAGDRGRTGTSVIGGLVSDDGMVPNVEVTPTGTANRTRTTSHTT